MIDISTWQNMEETQRLLVDCKKEVDRSKNSLTDFGGLIRSEKLEREYCYQVGYIEGVEFILKEIETQKRGDKDETTKTILGQSRNRGHSG